MDGYNAEPAAAGQDWPSSSSSRAGRIRQAIVVQSLQPAHSSGRQLRVGLDVHGWHGRLPKLDFVLLAKHVVQEVTGELPLVQVG